MTKFNFSVKLKQLDKNYIHLEFYIMSNGETFNLQTRHVKIVRNAKTYAKFENMPGNRIVMQPHTKKIIKSLEQCGSFHGALIVIKTKAFKGKVQYFMGDGQHRIRACKKLGMPFNYEIIEMVEDKQHNIIKYIANLNTSSKRWSTNNFLNSWSSLGYREYMVLQEVFESCELGIYDLLEIFQGDQNGAAFESGNLTFINEEHSFKMLEATKMIQKIIPNTYKQRRSTYPIMREVVDVMEFAQAVKVAGESLKLAGAVFAADKDEYKLQLLRICREQNVRMKPGSMKKLKSVSVAKLKAV